MFLVRPFITAASGGFGLDHPQDVHEFAPTRRGHLHVGSDDAFELRVGGDRLGIPTDRGDMNAAGVPRFQCHRLSRNHAAIPSLPWWPRHGRQAWRQPLTRRVDYTHGSSARQMKTDLGRISRQSTNQRSLR